MIIANTISAPLSATVPNHTDRLVSIPVADRSAFFPRLWEAARTRFGGYKVAEQFAVIFGCDVRSAARYIAGDRTPGGNETIAALLDPVVGPEALALLIDAARRTLSEADYQRFVAVMAEAALRAFVREHNSQE